MEEEQSIDYIAVSCFWCECLKYVMDIFFFNKQEKLPSAEEKFQASKGAEELRFQAMVN